MGLRFTVHYPSSHHHSMVDRPNVFYGYYTLQGTLGGIYRAFLDSQFVKSLEKKGLLAEGKKERAFEKTILEEQAARDPRTKQLATLLVCSIEDAARMAAQHPEVMEIPIDELLSRMIFLKELLPRCNITRMIGVAPRQLLEVGRCSFEASARANVCILKSNLEPADVDKMVEEEPDLLFRDLSGCMENLFDLWDVDDKTLENCNPKELALVITALSKDGPPLRM